MLEKYSYPLKKNEQISFKDWVMAPKRFIRSLNNNSPNNVLDINLDNDGM